MLKTKFTELTGCECRHISAIGSLARPQLAAAVTEAGGLGMLQLLGFTPAQASESLQEVRKRTRGVFVANFIAAEAWLERRTALRQIEYVTSVALSGLGMKSWGTKK